MILNKLQESSFKKILLGILFVTVGFVTFLNTYNFVILDGKHTLIYYGIYLSIFCLVLDLLIREKSKKNLIGLLIISLIFLLYYFFVSPAALYTIIFFLLVHLVYKINSLYFKDLYGKLVLSVLQIFFIFSLLIYVEIDLKNIYIVYFIYCLSIISIFLIKIKKIKKIDNFNIIRILPFLIALIFFSVFFHFTWDELNSLFWYPYQSYINGSFIDPGRPNTILMLSGRSIGQGFFSAIISQGDRHSFTFTMKLITAVLCFASVMAFISSFFKNNKLQLIFILVLFSMPIFKLQIFANFFDITSINYVLCSLYFLRKISQQKKENDILLYSLISGLSIYISLKCIPLAIVSYLIVMFYILKDKKTGLFIICSAAYGLFILISFTKAFVFTGNPFFPRLNYIFLSPYYSILKEGVSIGFTLDHYINYFDFFSIFSSNPEHNKQFYWGGIYSTFGFVAAISASVFFLPNKKIAHNYLLISIIAFFIITILIGPEHRYLVVVVLPFLLYSYLNIFIYFRNVPLLKSTFIYYILVSISLASLCLINFGSGNFSYNYKDKLFISNETTKWISKEKFYTKFNKNIENDKKILMYFLQDKFFIDNRYIFENDWYDFPFQQDLRKIWLKDGHQDNNEKLFHVAKYLCANNFKYYLWDKKSNFGDGIWFEYLKPHMESEFVNSYTIQCSNLDEIFKKTK